MDKHASFVKHLIRLQFHKHPDKDYVTKFHKQFYKVNNNL